MTQFRGLAKFKTICFNLCIRLEKLHKRKYFIRNRSRYVIFPLDNSKCYNLNHENASESGKQWNSQKCVKERESSRSLEYSRVIKKALHYLIPGFICIRLLFKRQLTVLYTNILIYSLDSWINSFQLCRELIGQLRNLGLTAELSRGQ